MTTPNLQALSLKAPHTVFYNGWAIAPNALPLAHEDEYIAVHDNYDGAPDAGRTLHNTIVTGPTPDDVLRQIREAEDEA